MKFIVLQLIVLLGACESSHEKLWKLEAEKNSLEITVDSLKTEIETLQKNPETLLNDAANNIKQGNLQTARHSLSRIKANQLRSGQIKEINNLISEINNRLEVQDFKNLSSADTSLYRSFINNYPKSKYANTIRKRLKKSSLIPATLLSGNSVQEIKHNPTQYKQRRYIPKNYSKSRIGAICCDGTRSYSTGRGACSHHGGVCQWLYQ